MLAQGAHERPLVFSGNDLPGVMLAGAVRNFVNRYGVLPGNRAIVVTNNDDAYRTALSLDGAGANVVVVDLRIGAAGPLINTAKDAGIHDYGRAHAVTLAEWRPACGPCRDIPVNEGGTQIIGDAVHMDCDLIAMSGGLSPAVHLHSQARGKLEWDDRTLCFKPSATHEASFNAGACNGSFELGAALREGARAGAKAASAPGSRRLLILKHPLWTRQNRAGAHSPHGKSPMVRVRAEGQRRLSISRMM